MNIKFVKSTLLQGKYSLVLEGSDTTMSIYLTRADAKELVRKITSAIFTEGLGI